MNTSPPKPTQARLPSRYRMLASLRKARISAAETERKLRILLTQSRDPVVELDAEGRVVEWNDAAESLLGWSRCEIRKSCFKDFALPLGERDAFSCRLANPQSGALAISTPLVRRDGAHLECELVFQGFRWENDRRFYVFIRPMPEAWAVSA